MVKYIYKCFSFKAGIFSILILRTFLNELDFTNPMDEKKQKQLQEKYMELQMLDQQMQQFQQQIQQLDEQIMELAYTKQSLDELKEVKQGTEIFVPVSPGIFAKAKIEDPSELLVNVGSSTSVKKSIDDTKKIIDEQQDELAQIHVQLNQSVNKIAEKAMQLEKDMEGLR